MNTPITLTHAEILDDYSKIKEFWRAHLYESKVKMPKLYADSNSSAFTVNALVLVYLFHGYPNTRIVSKEELTRFIRTFYPDTADVQQARHLGAQSGFWISAGGRDNIVVKLKVGEYKLHTLEQPYPNWKDLRRSGSGPITDFNELKLKYANRCATCGSQEDKPHLHWPQRKTNLQRGHMNPDLPLTLENTIPQCEICNQAYLNKWVFDDKGRVIAIASPSALEGASPELKRRLYEKLQRDLGLA